MHEMRAILLAKWPKIAAFSSRVSGKFRGLKDQSGFEGRLSDGILEYRLCEGLPSYRSTMCGDWTKVGTIGTTNPMPTVLTVYDGESSYIETRRAGNCTTMRARGRLLGLEPIPHAKFLDTLDEYGVLITLPQCTIRGVKALGLELVRSVSPPPTRVPVPSGFVRPSREAWWFDEDAGLPLRSESSADSERLVVNVDYETEWVASEESAEGPFRYEPPTGVTVLDF